MEHYDITEYSWANFFPPLGFGRSLPFGPVVSCRCKNAKTQVQSARYTFTFMSDVYAYAGSITVSNFVATNHYMQGAVFPLNNINVNCMKPLISIIHTQNHIPILRGRINKLLFHHLLAIVVFDSLIFAASLVDEGNNFVEYGLKKNAL